MNEKTLKEELIYKGKILNLKKVDVLLDTGVESVREIVEHKGAVAIVVFKENKFLFVKQYRKAFDEILTEIPAGKLEEAENPYDCALRELEEETGYIAEDMELMQIIYPTPGFCTEKIYLYNASKIKKGNVKFDVDEDLTSEWIEKEEVIKMISNGDIKDGKTIIGVVLYTLLL
jgi:ADP-ribose pyrophosphatase